MALCYVVVGPCLMVAGRLRGRFRRGVSTVVVSVMFQMRSAGEGKAVLQGRGHLAKGREAHVVHFYPADGELAASVSLYLAAGLKSGEGVIVVATEPHRMAFLAGVAQAGIDVTQAEREGRLLVIDATALLGTFSDGDRLDRDRFAAAVSGLVDRAGAGTTRPVRVYGEMVTLLWEAGQVSLAIELEELWNALAARLPFSLLCGYPAGVLDVPELTGAVAEVRRLHGAAADARSFPAEIDSVRAARHYVTGLLEPTADEALADDAAIAVTELAANAVLHARSAFTVVVSRWPARIRIAVRDNAPVARGPDALAADGESADSVPFPLTTGHGLSIVAKLASRWGVEPTPAGKVVWAELDAC
jgi:anti-sigma regulatory factor (Ser/Thr protein kinase)